MIMKIKAIRELSEEEINAKMLDFKQQIAKERAVIAIGSRPDKPKKVNGLKKDIARMLTIKRERELKGIKGKEKAIKEGKKEMPKKTGKEKKEIKAEKKKEIKKPKKEGKL